MDIFAHGPHRRSFGLKYWILGMLYKQDMSGAMVIDTMSQKSFGIWRPSPGSIYPMLKDMEKNGEITVKKTIATQKIYGITEKGRKSLDSIEMPLVGRFWESDGTSVSGTIDTIEDNISYLEDKAQELGKDKSSMARLKKVNGRISKLLEQ